jgi:hypothetical protein
MDETFDAIKEYWPWALGIVAGGYVLLRFFGGGTGDAVDDSGASFGVSENQIELAKLNAQLSSDIATQQIQADVQKYQADVQAVANFNAGIADITRGFYQSEITAYQADAATVTAIAQQAGAVAVSNIQAQGAAQASYNASIGQIGVATGEIAKGAATIVSSVAQANAASAAAAGNLISSVVGAYAGGYF